MLLRAKQKQTADTFIHFSQASWVLPCYSTHSEGASGSPSKCVPLLVSAPQAYTLILHTQEAAIQPGLSLGPQVNFSLSFFLPFFILIFKFLLCMFAAHNGYIHCGKLEKYITYLSPPSTFKFFSFWLASDSFTYFISLYQINYNKHRSCQTVQKTYKIHKMLPGRWQSHKQ